MNMSQPPRQYTPPSRQPIAGGPIRPQKPKQSKVGCFVASGIALIVVFNVGKMLMPRAKSSNKDSQPAKSRAQDVNPMADIEYSVRVNKRRELGLPETSDYRTYVVIESSYATEKKNEVVPEVKTFLKTPIEVTKEKYPVLQQAITKHKQACLKYKNTLISVDYILPLNQPDESFDYHLRAGSIYEEKDYRSEGAEAAAMYSKETAHTLAFLDAIYGHTDGKMHSFPEAVQMVFPASEQKEEDRKRNKKERDSRHLDASLDNKPIVYLNTFALQKHKVTGTLMTGFVDVSPSNYAKMQEILETHRQIRSQRSNSGKITNTEVLYFPPLDGSDGSKSLAMTGLGYTIGDTTNYIDKRIKAIFGQYDGKLHNPSETAPLIK